MLSDWQFCLLNRKSSFKTIRPVPEMTQFGLYNGTSQSALGLTEAVRDHFENRLFFWYLNLWPVLNQDKGVQPNGAR